MHESEVKAQILEEIEFELIMAERTGNANLVPGLQRALIIVEEAN
jgi:hypothetical protein